MKIRFSTLLILLIISLMPQMSNVTGISEPKIDLPNNLLESEEFKPDWQKLNVSNSPSARDLTPLVYDSINKKTILFGGYTSSNRYDDTWVFDHETMNWTEMYPTNSPPSTHHGHRMVFDPITEQIIMHGAVKTWAYSYKNNTWVDLNPVNEPNFSYYQAMVYDNINNVVLMTQGQNTYAYHSINNTWVNTATTNPCSGTGSFYSFDQKHGKFIYYRDQKTCAYDYPSNTWTQLNPNSYPPQNRGYGSSMIYDPILKQSILFGGWDPTYDTTWSFDYNTTSWTQILTDNAPSSRGLVGMTYDSDKEVVILFGGRTDSTHFAETWQFTPHEYVGSEFKFNNLPNNVDYNLGSSDNLVFNITTSNATTYDIFLNSELINSYEYSDNDTITLDLNSIYSNYIYSNYTVFNNTKFEFTNLTLVFNNAQNDTYTHSINVKVFDKLPIMMDHDSINIEYEIGTSLPLEFQISDDNPDMIYIYKDNKLIYFNNWSNPYDTYLNANDFINSTNMLGNNYYKVIFEDKDNNQAEYNLQINIVDTVNPVFTSIKADDYIEGEDFGIISFSVEDITLDRYAVVVNDAELENSTFDETSYIEVSNAGFLEGQYNVEIIVYDRGNNMVSFTTSFTVKTKDVTNNTTLPSSTTTVTETTTETNNITITETTQNGTNNVSIPEGAPISDLPLMLFVGISGLYILRRKNQALIKTQN